MTRGREPLAWRDPDWQERAVCAHPSLDGLDWFPVRVQGPGDQGPYKRRVAFLRGICAGCPVKPQCAVLALDQWPHGSGVWAGVDISVDPWKARRQLQQIAKGEP